MIFLTSSSSLLPPFVCFLFLLPFSTLLVFSLPPSPFPSPPLFSPSSFLPLPFPSVLSPLLPSLSPSSPSLLSPPLSVPLSPINHIPHFLSPASCTPPPSSLSPSSSPQGTRNRTTLRSPPATHAMTCGTVCHLQEKSERRAKWRIMTGAERENGNRRRQKRIAKRSSHLLHLFTLSLLLLSSLLSPSSSPSFIYTIITTTAKI